MDPGDVVVTEIHGGEQWIELYNASGRELDLSGLTLRTSGLDGSGLDEIPLRQPGTPLIVPSGGYFVAGAAELSDFVWTGVFDDDLHDAAVLEVRSCQTQIDRVLWRNLPDTGSWQFGESPPTAAGNDDENAFCASATASGTPKQENPACP